MSRAFVKEDNDDARPRRTFGLPSPRDPAHAAAAALALIEAARDGFTADAEEATGYKWGESHRRPHVQKLMDKELERPDEEQDRRFIQMARRFLRYE